MNLRCKKMKQLAKTFLHGHCKSAELQDFKENCKHVLLNTLNACRARTENMLAEQQEQRTLHSNSSCYLEITVQTLRIALIYLISKRIDLFPYTCPSCTRTELAVA